MALYYIIENNTIVSGPTLLPAPLQLTPSEELVKLGWYPVIQNLPETFREREEVLSDPVLEIGDGVVYATYTKRNKTDEEMGIVLNEEWNRVREYRNKLLSDTDYITTGDRWAALSDEQKTAWATYRQALRDIPQTFDSPLEVVFPTKE